MALETSEREQMEKIGVLERELRDVEGRRAEGVGRERDGLLGRVEGGLLGGAGGGGDGC